MSQRTHCSIYAACITPYSSGTCFTKTDIKSFTSSAVADSPQCGLRVTDEMGRTSPSRSLARLRMLPRNTRSTKSSNKICRVALGLSFQDHFTLSWVDRSKTERKHHVLVLPLHGPSFFTLLHTNNKPLFERMSAAKQILQAIASIHSAGLFTGVSKFMVSLYVHY